MDIIKIALLFGSLGFIVMAVMLILSKVTEILSTLRNKR